MNFLRFQEEAIGGSVATLSLKDRLIEGLRAVPETISLTPVREKRPYRKGWQSEEPIERQELIRLIRNGDRQFSEKKQKYWTAHPDGYGIRFGNEYIGVDVDGFNAIAILENLSQGDNPKTVEWTSGKPGRKGLIYRISDQLQSRLKDISFTHLAIYEAAGVERLGDEQLDLRYDRCQSVIPPSCHPQTGEYKWVRSFQDCEIADAPQWLENYLFAYCDRIEEQIREREQAKIERLKEDFGFSSNSQDLPALIEQALACIPPRQPGSGNYGDWQKIIPAVIDGVGEIEAERLIERYSPSIPGKWDVAYKVRSFARSFGRANQITAGTLFHIAQQHGFKFPQVDRKPSQPFDPDPIGRAERMAQDAERDRIEQAQEKEWQHDRRATNKARFSTEVVQNYEYLSRLDSTPTLEIEGVIPSGAVTLPQEGGLVLIDGTMGLRKTSVAGSEIVKQHRSQNTKADAVLFAPTNNTGLQAGYEVGLPHHKSGAILNNEFLQITACFQSAGAILSNLELREVEGRPLIMIDEAEQVVCDLLEGSTYGDRHAYHVSLFMRLVAWVKQHDGWIVCLEDGLTNLLLDIFKDLDFPLVSYVKATKKHKKRTITIKPGKKQILHQLLEEIEDGGNVFYPSDNQNHLRQVALILSEKFDLVLVDQSNYLDTEKIAGKAIAIIDSENSHEAWVKEVLKNPNRFTERVQPRLMGVSPTVKSGFSHTDTNNHFDLVLGTLTHLEPRVAKQMPERLRTDVERVFAVNERSTNVEPLYRSAHPDLIKRSLLKNTARTTKFTQFAQYAADRITKSEGEVGGDKFAEGLSEIECQASEITTPYGFWLKHFCRMKARESYAKQNMRDELIQHWANAGYQVEFGGQIDRSENQQMALLFEDAKQRLERKQAEREANDRDNENLSVSEAREVLRAYNSTPEQRLAAKKRIRKDSLPGLEDKLDDVEFVLKAFISDRGNFSRGAERYWLMQHPEIAKTLDRWELHGKYTNAVKNKLFVPIHRIRHRYAQSKTLNNLESLLNPFIDGTIAEWDDNTPEAKAIWDYFNAEGDELAKKRRETISTYNRLSIHPKRKPAAIVNTLLRHIGFATEEVSQKGRRKERTRQYAIVDREDADRNLIIEALQRRFIQRCKELDEPLPQNCEEFDDLEVVVKSIEVLVAAGEIDSAISFLDSLPIDYGNQIRRRLSQDIRAALEVQKPEAA
ncbi:hypothetical protein NIES2135_34210 [Leptolyngbya boryana NIES-2135]|jgi:hypothetical protein|uniref:DNA primase/polymerase bifunctional N-terminal domain-containing protein n=1 Tax=Leptolyngbya boryana NIES-2135 TaxID=1973484 RepID=A0A1Z4JJ55_LEPBY|nr:MULTISPECIES: bifunctional DNA primase/polymerase [Leptolyngbya]BAY56587.1 hypothetical protein NIES2135_34210 [Leptolyngbya boryana NIES-2135]MBD2369890.1 bifunctional DNA primase/polymerase [Leptolyngbya sp. FACHB-161]MBD2376165.1 bifunctional DNA primase/polymerase [Leptolyngbya sp. FACHB-238]MBD2400440.1 bifunctional DNA primase/polymerase [Leptolyngbya sp. FACHB-239]MBD2406982.1 bifunctional DNA primase/polymerase [Leptolyngbya sp. FACHB-402]